MAKLTVLYFEIGKEPVPLTIESELEEYQRLVGGDIEALGLNRGLTLICNEEGKIHGLAPNRLFVIGGGHHEVIVGNFFITRVDADGEFADLTEGQMAAARSISEVLSLEGLTPEMFTYQGTFRAGIKWVHSDDGPQCPHECYQYEDLGDLRRAASGLMSDPGITEFKVMTHAGGYKRLRTLYQWKRAAYPARVYREAQLDDIAYKVLAVLQAEFPGHAFDATDLNLMLQNFLAGVGYTEVRDA